MNRNKYGDSLTEIVSAYSPEKIKKYGFSAAVFTAEFLKLH